MRVELLSQATIVRLARKLAHAIQDSGYEPDVIVAIARGGYVPARLLCDYLDIYRLASFRISHYTGAEKLPEAVLTDPLCAELHGKNVLLVDDVDDSGETLALARDYLATFGPGELRVAVLHHKRTSCLLPDYYAQTVVRWRWLVYPWAVTEDVLGFVRRMRPIPASIDEACRRVDETYGVRISRQAMADVFRLLDRGQAGERNPA